MEKKGNMPKFDHILKTKSGYLGTIHIEILMHDTATVTTGKGTKMSAQRFHKALCHIDKRKTLNTENNFGIKI